MSYIRQYNIWNTFILVIFVVKFGTSDLFLFQRNNNKTMMHVTSIKTSITPIMIPYIDPATETIGRSSSTEKKQNPMLYSSIS